MNIEELLLANAGAQGPCPKGDSYCLSQGLDCEGCRGREWVYALPDAVRVPCPGWPVHPDLLESGKSYCSHNTECLCEGRGWVPATDGSVWWKLLPTAFPEANLVLSTCIDSQKLRHWRFKDKYTKVYKCDQDALWLLLDWMDRALVAAGSK